MTDNTVGMSTTTIVTRSPTMNPGVIAHNSPNLDVSIEQLIDLDSYEAPPTPPTVITKQKIISSTPAKKQKLKTAVQTRLVLHSPVRKSTPSPIFLRPRPYLSRTPAPDSDAELPGNQESFVEEQQQQQLLAIPARLPTRRPTKHIHTRNKAHDWALSVNQKWVFLGDSNLAKFPPFSHEHLQIESYPGATLKHAEKIIRKANVTAEVEQVILAFGLNNRSQREHKLTRQHLLAAVKAADETFPHADVWVPIVNFSKLLPKNEQRSLTYLNGQIRRNCLSMPCLPTSRFHTLNDNIHWTKLTAKYMLEHWVDHINVSSP